MLQHLSNRFKQDVDTQTREPRAALFLNRFTRTLTIMYATSGIEQVIGIPSDAMKGRSFYYCIAESCLEDAVKCLESAKGNDSIAYLRFMYRDPRQDDEPETSEEDSDAIMTDAGAPDTPEDTTPLENTSENVAYAPDAYATHGRSSSSSDRVTSSQSGSTTQHSSRSPPLEPPVELEAVVSCTSDGLVVCLRRARPIVPGSIQSSEKTATSRNVSMHPGSAVGYQHQGFFAAPWAQQPVYSPYVPPGYANHSFAFPGIPVAYGGPPLPSPAPTLLPPQSIASSVDSGGPDPLDFLRSIQECGVFAWDLCGINGTLAEYSRGAPGGRAVPSDGYPVWDPSVTATVAPGPAEAVHPPGAPTVGSGNA
jgi:hypothetical protein